MDRASLVLALLLGVSLRVVLPVFGLVSTLDGLFPQLGWIQPVFGQSLDEHSYLLEDERNTIEIFREASASVVFITNTQIRRSMFSRNVMEVPRGSGSGFVWDRKGHVVTNFHVIEGGDEFTVTLSDGSTHDAKVVGADITKDIAVLEIEPPRNGLTPVKPGDTRELLVGQKVIAIGNPFGLDQTLTTGVVSALGREIRSVGNRPITDVIQTDASINPGNSGGPLLDSSGRLIGMNTAIYSTSGSSAGIGFAVPVTTIKRVVPQLIEFGRTERAGLGVTLVSDDLAQRWGVSGVIINEVQPGSAAADAGLRGTTQNSRREISLGDVIVGVDELEVAVYDDLYKALDRRNPGDLVTLRYRRGDHLHEAKVQLQRLP
ncbi:MAG: trypsin-like peptidase domain-containing protein [Candidatus Eisenbacteria bacterium]|uniref:Trypsin-like peptidase domain-containing protein n=1 Tax=Eiseniibacteriota bacterium TaxID=2212470 RepID=A0A956SFS6_UNCEI|nr:trypsin-like peptidase domain-containing protein [Candidatus Eisenbacteria bacterium]